MNAFDRAIKVAVEAAEHAPEKYQVAAFAEILEVQLAKTISGVLLPQDHRSLPLATMVDQPKVGFTLPEPHTVIELDNNDAKVVWAVMSLNQKGIEATNKAIREEIDMNLGKKPQARQNTNRTIRRLVPKNLTKTRSTTGKGYSYVTTAHAVEVFSQSDDAD